MRVSEPLGTLGVCVRMEVNRAPGGRRRRNGEVGVSNKRGGGKALLPDPSC